MKLLLDSQIIFWWTLGDPKLPAEAKTLIARSDEVFVSVVSNWELAIKASTGKLNLDLADFAQQITQDGFEVLTLEPRHATRLASLPLFEDHKDPFDRMLIAQSLDEPLTFVTTDRKLARYSPTVTVLA
jgi:PIN domain nuclease of toxin-antitoxin system